MAKFYKCNECGSVVEELFNPNNSTHGNKEELVANTVDASKEKHVPVVEINGNVLTVSVGSVAHPMTPAHYIVFVQVITNMGVKRVDFTPDCMPVATFALLDGEQVKEVYAYCNLHGLWKA